MGYLKFAADGTSTSLDLEPIHDDFSENDIKAFNELINLVRLDREYSRFALDLPARFFEDVIFELSLSISRAALMIIADLYNEKLNQLDTISYDVYIDRLGSKYRHRVADNFGYMVKQVQELRALNMLIHKNSTEDAEIFLSELLAVAIINHAVVRYHLTNNKEILSVILKLMSENDILTIKHYCPTLLSEHQEIFSKDAIEKESFKKKQEELEKQVRTCHKKNNKPAKNYFWQFSSTEATISNEEMAASVFGQASNTAKNLARK